MLNRLTRSYFMLPCFLTSLLLLFTAAAPQTAPPSLSGKWRYLSSSGGFTGKGTAWDPTKKIIYEFKKNGTFKRRVQRKTELKDHYQITCNEAEGETSCTVNFNGQPPCRIEIHGDTLVLTELVADGFSYMLLKLN